MHTRHILPLLNNALADTPVVLLNGARQTGKSTLAQLTVCCRPVCCPIVVVVDGFPIDQKIDEGADVVTALDFFQSEARECGFFRADGCPPIGHFQRVPHEDALLTGIIMR